MKHLMLSFLISASVFGCSNQWRNVGVSFSKGEIVQSLYQQSSTASSYTSGGYADGTFWSMLESPSSALYFSESSEHFGPVASVFSMAEINWLDPYGTIYSPYDISSVSIYVLFDSASSPSQAALLVSYTPVSLQAPIYRFMVSQSAPTFDDGKFAVNLISDDGQSIQLRSRDFSGSNLKNVVQFQVYSSDGETLLGKFSTLVKVE